MNLVQLTHLYLMGSPSEGVTALCLCTSAHVGHFDKEGTNLSRIRRVMKVIEQFGRRRGVWKPTTAGADYWGGALVTRCGMGCGGICCLDLLPGQSMMMAEKIVVTRVELGISHGGHAIISLKSVGFISH